MSKKYELRQKWRSEMIAKKLAVGGDSSPVATPQADAGTPDTTNGSFQRFELSLRILPRGPPMHKTT